MVCFQGRFAWLYMYIKYSPTYKLAFLQLKQLQVDQKRTPASANWRRRRRPPPVLLLPWQQSRL